MSNPFAWPLHAERTPLVDDDVHVWCVELNGSARVERFLFELLSPDERDRAEGFYCQEHRNRYIMARGMLRTLLARYLEAEPDRLRFDYGPHGKPALADIHHKGQDRLRFNMSHSHELALYAMVRNHEIGIDVERVREGSAIEKVAMRFFSPQEIATLRSLPSSQQTQGFFNCWTRKEAYIKALGEGLSHPLDGFDVSLAPGVPAELLGLRCKQQEGSGWCLHELSLGPNYAATVAVQGKITKLNCWRWAG